MHFEEKIVAKCEFTFLDTKSTTKYIYKKNPENRKRSQKSDMIRYLSYIIETNTISPLLNTTE